VNRFIAPAARFGYAVWAADTTPIEEDRE